MHCCCCCQGTTSTCDSEGPTSRERILRSSSSSWSQGCLQLHQGEDSMYACSCSCTSTMHTQEWA